MSLLPLLNAIPNSAAIVDRHGIIAAANAPWLELAAASLDQISVGRNYLDICTTSASEDLVQNIRRVLTGSASEFFSNISFRSPDGSPLSYDVEIRAVSDNSDAAALVLHTTVSADRGTNDIAAELRERVKELQALHSVAQTLFQKPLEHSDLLSEIVALLPPAMRFPEVAAARITFDDLEATSVGFTTTDHRLSVDFKGGRIDVVYLSLPIGVEPDPCFLPEEERLLISIGDMLGSYLHRERTAAEFKSNNRRFKKQNAALNTLTKSSLWQVANYELALKEITETVAEALDVARVSIWHYSADPASIESHDLYEASSKTHSSGHKLTAIEVPSYFKALATSEIISAKDARHDQRTSEFTESYLQPLDIYSMLDAPIIIDGELQGVVCLENVGYVRQWSPAEELFAISIANLVSLMVAQRAKLRSENRLRAIVESEPECVQIVDCDGVITDMNPAGLRLLESGALAEIKNRRFEEFIHAGDREIYRSLHEASLEGNSRIGEFRIIGLRGTTRWVEAHTAPLFGDDDEVSSILSVTRDITARRRAEQALLKVGQAVSRKIGDDFFEDLTQSMSASLSAKGAVIGLIDGTNKNRVSTQTFVLDDAIVPNVCYDLVGTPCEDVVRGQERVYDHGIRELFPSDLMLVELGLESYAGVPLLGSSGTPVGIVAVFFDRPIEDSQLTLSALRIFASRATAEMERKEKDADLAAARSQNELILNSVGEGIHGLDKNGYIIFENPTAAECFGWPPNEITGKHSHSTIHHHRKDGSEYPIHLCPIYQTLRDGITRTVTDEVFFRRDGSSFPVEYVCSPVLDANGDINGAVVSFRDVSDVVLRSQELKRANDELAQSQLLLQIAGRAARLGGWTITLPDRTLVWSDETCYIHDLEPGQTPTREEALSLFPPEHRATIQRLVYECEHFGRPYDVELQKFTATGRLIWARAMGEAVRDDEGNIVRLQGAFQDITAVKAAEESLMASNQRFRQLADAMPFIVWTAQADGTVNFSNSQFFDYTGVDPLEPAEKRWQPCLHPEDTDRCMEHWSRSVATYDPFDIEYRLRRGSDGEYRWFRVQARPIRDPEGTVTSWYGTAIDIHETKRLEQNATHLANRLRTTFESITDGLFLVDRDWRFTYVNPEAERLLLRASKDLLGRTLWGEFPEAVDTLAWNKYQRAMEENVTVSFEFYFPPFEKWFDVKAYPSEEGLAVYFRDITTLHEHREKMRESDERFHLLAKATNDAIWDWDLITDSLWWNEGSETLFGFARDEVEPTLASWTKCIHPEDRDNILGDIHKAIESGQDAWSAEYRFMRNDGTYANVLDRGYVIHDAAGVPIRMIGGMTDLTDRKNLEAQLLQSQKMEAVGQLAGGVAHDFNNLLTVINGYSDLLLRSMDEDSPHRTRVTAIRDAGDRAANLTRQMLAFSRKQILAPKVLDLNEIVDGMNKLLRRLIGEDISFTSVLDPALHPIKVDPGQIEQVLLNLAVNARDAMPHGGRLTIATSNTTVHPSDPLIFSGLAPGNYVRLRVTDSGVGIPSELVDRIFEPFFTTKEAGKGTGLGLATVFGIIKQSEGHVEVKSEPGAGAQFTIWLPSVARIATSEEEAPEIMTGGNETILLVEDEDAVRRIARLALETYGYRVLEAHEANSAVDTFETVGEQIDMVVTDVIMPGRNGRELAEQLRIIRPDVKMLYMSGYTDDAVIARGVSEAKDAFLQKPFTPQALARAVRDVLDGSVGNGKGKTISPTRS